MKIIHIETRIVEHEIRADHVIVSNLGRHVSSRYLVVIVHGDDRLKGYGEAATTPGWSGETAEGARHVIEDVFAPRLITGTFEHPAEALQVMDTCCWGNPFAKSAVDTALWDLWAKIREVSVSELIADREPVESIPTRSSVGCYPVEDTLRIATDFWEAGIRTLKFKIGVKGYDDVARLAAVRDKFGDEPVFTVDANGAYSNVKEAVAAVEELLPFNLALVEQPTPRDSIRMLAEVRERVDVPILADEAVFTPANLEEALYLDAFDILSVYPGKNGGFSHALNMANRAKEAGKVCAIGSNLETDLGQAAMATLASGLSVFPVEEIACDLPGAMYYPVSSVTPPLELERGRVKAPVGLGFGVAPVE